MDSLHQQQDVDFETIFVTNGADDCPSKRFGALWPETTILRTDSNLGFCAGANFGAQNARGRYILFIQTNSWLKQSTLAKLVETIQAEPRCGIAGPLLLNEDRSLRSVGMRIDLLGQPLPNKDLFGADTDTVDNVFFVANAAMLIDRDLFSALGGFDEMYYSGLADADICWRARLIGHRVVVNPWAIAFSDQSYAERDAYLDCRNSLRMIIKNYSLARASTSSAKFIAVALGESVKSLGTLRPGLFLKYWKALGWNLIMLPNSIIARRLIQRSRREDDEMVLKNAMIEEEGIHLSSTDRAA